MKTTLLLLALCLVSLISFAQGIPINPPSIGASSSLGGGNYNGPLPPHPPATPYISTIAGNGTGGFSGDGGQATAAELYYPDGMVFDGLGNLYVADQSNNRIRKINTSGVISTFAGTGTAGFSGDGGQATAAKLYIPVGVTFDASGNMYIGDYGNSRIRKINTSGIISTFAGNGTAGYSGDGGQATAAEINEAYSICTTGGNFYIADTYNNRVRKINSSGVISTFAGTGTAGYSGDGGQATAAKLNFPTKVAIDVSSNLFITDATNNRIRKVNTAGIISTYAGSGTAGYSGDAGQATAADLHSPAGIAFDASGNLFIADWGNNVVRLVSSTGVIWTWAGNGTAGYSGDCGSAGSAELSGPRGVAVDAYGNITVTDASNQLIRKLWPISSANAGPNEVDQQDDCGNWPGVQIGTTGITGIGGLNYSWSPSTALNSTTIAQPISVWSNTATPQVYTLSVTIEGCTATTSTVQVTAVGCGGGCINGCRTENIVPLNQTSSAFVVYPNPSTEQVTLSLYDKTDYIYIIDMQGRLVYEKKGIEQGDFIIDISQYKKGIYFIMAKIGNNFDKQKLIVE